MIFGKTGKNLILLFLLVSPLLTGASLDYFAANDVHPSNASGAVTRTESVYGQRNSLSIDSSSSTTAITPVRSLGVGSLKASVVTRQASLEARDGIRRGSLEFRGDFQSLERSFSPVDPPAKSIIQNVPLTINIVLVGVDPSSINQAQISSLLPSWYAQIDRAVQISTGAFQVYANYTLTYNFVNASSGFLNGLLSFENTHSYLASCPSYYGCNSTQKVVEISAEATESWIANNRGVYGLDLPGYTIFVPSVIFSNTSSNQLIPHFYNMSVPDYEVGIDRHKGNSSYVSAYGGHYNFLFMDIGAGPAFYGVAPFGCAFTTNASDLCLWPAAWQFDSTNQSQVNEFSQYLGITFRFGIELRFIPSFLYAPEYHGSYYVEFRIFTGDIDYTKYFSPSVLTSQLHNLDPYSTFNINVSEQTVQSDPNLYPVVQSATISPGLLNGSTIINYFQNNWQKYVVPHGTDRILPVFVLGGYKTNVFFGVAAGDSNGNPIYVLDAINQTIAMKRAGLTQLNVHEVGHFLGLSHPHDGWDWSNGFQGAPAGGFEFLYWFWDFSATPMTYITSNLEYDYLNQQNLGQGLTAFLVNKTQTELSQADSELHRLGFALTPPNVSNNMSLANLDSTTARSYFSNQSTVDYDKSAKYALSAYNASLKAVSSIYSSLASVNFIVRDAKGLVLPNGTISVVLPNGTFFKGTISFAAGFKLTSLPWGPYKINVTLTNSTTTRYVFTKWSNGATSNPGTVNITGSSENVLALYTTQYLETFQFAVVDGGSPAPPTASFSSVGLTLSIRVSPTGISEWVDALTNVSYPALINSSTAVAGERWFAAENSFAATQPSIFDPSYHHQFYLNVQENAQNGGIISPLSGWVDSGTRVQISASAAPGWKFVGWNGTDNSSNSNFTLILTSPDMENTIFFAGLTINASAGGTVSYSYGSTSGSVSGGTTQTIYVPPNTNVTLVASPTLVFAGFTGWREQTNSKDAQISLIVGSPSNVQAEFAYNYLSAYLVVLVISIAAVSMALFLIMRRRRKFRFVPPVIPTN